MRLNRGLFNNDYYFHLYYIQLKLDSIKNKKILDFGCNDGEFLGSLHINNDLYGYDVDEEKINIAKDSYKNIKFHAGKVGEKLPYKNNFFDVVILMHVLEHVPSEKEALDEIYRVLKKNGLLIIASPYKGLFSWADIANVRYKFPKLHRLFGRFVYGRTSYDEKFLTKRKSKMFGDSSIGVNWHKHYKEFEINELLKEKFKVNMFLKYSFFLPFFLIFNNIYYFIFKRHSSFINRMIEWDSQLKVGDYSYFFIVTSKKI